MWKLEQWRLKNNRLKTTPKDTDGGTAQRLDPGRVLAGGWSIYGGSKDKGKDHHQTDKDTELQSTP